MGAEDASSGLVPLRFSADVRTNSIIAIGGGDALRVVEAILLRLDESDVRQRKTTVIKLRNSPATDIAAAINTFLQSQRDLANINPESGQQYGIVGTANHRGRRTHHQQLADLRHAAVLRRHSRFDSRPWMPPRKQVIIQALLVEVTLDNTDEFGMELGFQDERVCSTAAPTQAADLLTIQQTTTAPSNGVQTSTQQIISQATTPGFRFNDPTYAVPLGNNVAASPSL